MELFGDKLDFPLVLAPVGFAGVYARRGEVQAARAAAKANIPFSLATLSVCSIEEVANHSNQPFWFQFYMFKQRELSLELMLRAERAGCKVLLWTADLPTPGTRYRYQRSRRSGSFRNFLDMGVCPTWFFDVRLRGGPLTLGNLPTSAPLMPNLSTMRQWMGANISKNFSWEDFEWVRKHWKGKILIKGILEPEDALLAKEAGADAIVVSNHGGRHFDGTRSTISALPSICSAVKGKVKILLDGGVTSGLDIVKALAVGADACMIGRPWVYGLAARGELGVTDILEILKKEMKMAMTHLGVSTLQGISPNLIH
jgi:L-lactate dehydrogenase (cytochrome)